MVRLLRLLVIAIVAILLLLFAFANHHRVTVSLDPFASVDDAAIAFETPLFVVAIGAAMLGVIAGAAATWISQGRHRRAARRYRREAETLKSTTQRTAPPLPRS